jgi:hypothetical protein
MTNEKLLELFDKLTEYTYIYGLEDELMDIINPILPKPLTRDEYGNYFIKIGESKTLFCCHLDTVGRQKLKINKVYFERKGHKFVKTDENTILGADDKTGMVIMLNMIDNNVPGMYYFLIGEEKGTVGSGLLYTRKSQMILSKYDRCVAFDRRGYGSIINRQMGKFCCSDEFATALAAQLRANGMRFRKDPTGVWTDSALFMGVIPECTNLSVGYANEHRTTEEQDLDYMVKLADTATKINWEKLPTVREPQPMDTIDPEEVEEREEHLSERKLADIFDELDTIIYNVTHQFASNCNFFKPEKEMTYFGIKDLAGGNNFSAYVHWDGSITLKKGRITTSFTDLEMVKSLYQGEVMEEILSFKRGYDFVYKRKDGEIQIVYYNKPKLVKKFDNFKNDKKV